MHVVNNHGTICHDFIKVDKNMTMSINSKREDANILTLEKGFKSTTRKS